MNIKDIDHIARLARLDISRKEKQKLAKELANVFSYIEQLQKADTSDTEPTAHVGGLKNITRSDEATTKNEAEQELLRSRFPDRSGKALRVPQVFVKDTTDTTNGQCGNVTM